MNVLWYSNAGSQSLPPCHPASTPLTSSVTSPHIWKSDRSEGSSDPVPLRETKQRQRRRVPLALACSVVPPTASL